MYHVDWDHNISVNDEPCANCGVLPPPPPTYENSYEPSHATPPSGDDTFEDEDEDEEP